MEGSGATGPYGPARPLWLLGQEDPYAVFNNKLLVERKAIVRTLLMEMNLTGSKRLYYELGSRPGYTLETLQDILLMIAFPSDEVRSDFISRACACVCA